VPLKKQRGSGKDVSSVGKEELGGKEEECEADPAITGKKKGRRNPQKG